MADRVEGGWYQLFRKRIAPVAFLIALGLLATRTCTSESASAEIRFVVGEPGPAIRSFDVSLHSGEDQEALAYWRHEFPNGSPDVAGTWKFTADKGVYSLHFEIRTVARHVSFRRAVQIDDNAKITVDIERDLTGPDGGRR